MAKAIKALLVSVLFICINIHHKLAQGMKMEGGQGGMEEPPPSGMGGSQGGMGGSQGGMGGSQSGMGGSQGGMGGSQGGTGGSPGGMTEPGQGGMGNPKPMSGK